MRFIRHVLKFLGSWKEPLEAATVVIACVAAVMYVWTQVSSIDEQVEDRVNNKFEESRKDQLAKIEATTAQNAVEREAWTAVESMRDAICKEDYPKVELVYDQFAERHDLGKLPNLV